MAGNSYSRAITAPWVIGPPTSVTKPFIARNSGVQLAKHQSLRDDVLGVFSGVSGLAARAPQAGSYLFPRLPGLESPLHVFVRALRVQAGVTVTP